MLCKRLCKKQKQLTIVSCVYCPVPKRSKSSKHNAFGGSISTHVQAFSHIGVEAACGRPFFKENCLIFHMLPLKFSFEQTLWQILDAHFSNLDKSLVMCT